jgi:hypothetical protein
VLVALAIFASRPSHKRTGKVRRVPPPAIAFIAPAEKAVTKMMNQEKMDIGEWETPTRNNQRAYTDTI